jgi:putative transposase
MLTEFAGPEQQRALERFPQLRPHLEENVPLERIAGEAAVLLRTAQRWDRRYQEWGLAGLIHTGRTDRSKHRRIHNESRQLA